MVCISSLDISSNIVCRYFHTSASPYFFDKAILHGAMEVDESNILDDEEGADTLASLEYTNLESDGLLALTRQLQVAKRIIFIIIKMYFFSFSLLANN